VAAQNLKLEQFSLCSKVPISGGRAQPPPLFKGKELDKEKVKILREKYAGSFDGKRDHMNFQDESTTFIKGKKVRRFYTAIISKRNRQRRKDGRPSKIKRFGKSSA